MNVTNIADPGQLTRDADAALERISAARAEIGGVIFGQERVVDLALTTLLAGGHGLLIGVPGLAKTKLVETLGIVVGLEALQGAVHPRPDADRHSRLRGDGGRPGRQARLPLHQGADLRPIADGRRDQPRQSPHPVGAAAGDAGASCHGRRRAARSAAPVPCAGDAEPARAGRRLSAARGAARSLPDADRRRLSRPGRRTPDSDRDDRRARGAAEAGR